MFGVSGPGARRLVVNLRARYRSIFGRVARMFEMPGSREGTPPDAWRRRAVTVLRLGRLVRQCSTSEQKGAERWD